MPKQTLRPVISSTKNIWRGIHEMPVITAALRAPAARKTLRCLLLMAILACSITAPISAQVNTEALRHDSQKQGFENRIGLNLEYQSGNSDYLDLSGNYRLDYLSGPLYAFLVGNYERGSGSGNLFLNDAFVHLRFTYALDSMWRLELFTQKEFNDFIQLRDRDLAGGGVRIELLSAQDSASAFSLHLGVGAMFESELVFDSVDTRTNLLRSTNYLTLAWRINKLVRFTATSYYQIAPAHSSDFRVLAEGSLGIQLSDLLSLETSTHYRYDHDPPRGLKRYDFHIVNGLGIHF